MTRSGLLPPEPRGCRVVPADNPAPSAPIRRSRGTSRTGAAPSPDRRRRAWRSSSRPPPPRSRRRSPQGQAVRGPGLRQWFTVHARAPEGVPRIDPAVLGADALAATLAGSRWMAKENASSAFVFVAASACSAGPRSPAALIAKGKLPCASGTTRARTTPSPTARAANDAALREDARLRRAAAADADAAAAVSPAHANNLRGGGGVRAGRARDARGRRGHNTGGDRHQSVQSVSSRASSRADVVHANLRCVLTLGRQAPARGGLFLRTGNAPRRTRRWRRRARGARASASRTCNARSWTSTQRTWRAARWMPGSPARTGRRRWLRGKTLIWCFAPMPARTRRWIPSRHDVVTIRESGGEAGKDAEEEKALGRPRRVYRRVPSKCAAWPRATRATPRAPAPPCLRRCSPRTLYGV